MNKVTWRGGAMLAPVPPVLVTCGTMEDPNVFTVGWTGIVNTIPPRTYISIRPSRLSFDLIKESGHFTINLTTVDLLKATDYCGVKSGRDFNKFKEMNLTPTPSSQVTSPQLLESPLSLECKVFDIIPLGSHHMFLADIVAVNARESLIDKSGRLRLDRASLLAYAHGEYYELGKTLGKFGHSVMKKKTKKSKMDKTGKATSKKTKMDKTEKAPSKRGKLGTAKKSPLANKDKQS